MKLAAALILLPLPAHAAGNAPASMADLVPQQWRVSVIEVSCQELLDCCGLHRPCGDWYQRPPDPAPVPLPAPLYLLASAMVLMCCLKGKRHA
jgi:hypothetical protein